MTARTIRRVAGVAGMLALWAGGTAVAGSDAKTLDEALTLAKERDLPVLVDFGTEW